jgi:glycine/D-amino acid oxidase-like deaminating enzyme
MVASKGGPAGGGRPLFDVIVVGGSYAGLASALQLLRFDVSTVYQAITSGSSSPGT